MRKILVAVDGSECATRAVEYTGMQFSGIEDLSVTLLHVLPNLPPGFWDDGHILSKQERQVQSRASTKWLENQKHQAEQMFHDAIDVLEQKGIPAKRVETKVILDSCDVTTSILDEARNGGYLTLVVGRHAFPRAHEFFVGSTTNGIIHQGAGIAVCVVE